MKRVKNRMLGIKSSTGFSQRNTQTPKAPAFKGEDPMVAAARAEYMGYSSAYSGPSGPAGPKGAHNKATPKEIEDYAKELAKGPKNPEPVPGDHDQSTEDARVSAQMARIRAELGNGKSMRQIRAADRASELVAKNGKGGPGEGYQKTHSQDLPPHDLDVAKEVSRLSDFDRSARGSAEKAADKGWGPEEAAKMGYEEAQMAEKSAEELRGALYRPGGASQAEIEAYKAAVIREASGRSAPSGNSAPSGESGDGISVEAILNSGLIP